MSKVLAYAQHVVLTQSSIESGKRELEMNSVTAAQMQIPLVDLRSQYKSLQTEILSAITAVLEQMNLLHGPELHAFEEEFAHYCGCREAIGVSNGTDALELALRSLAIRPGDEVITQPNSFIATAEAISAVGATPVFVDVEPHSATLDPALLEASITSRTKAVIPVHLYGHPAEMEQILSICRAHNLAVIEDASQAHGAKIGDKRVGSLGDLACFSFYYSKNLGAYGEAGAITTSNHALAEQIRLYRDHGSQMRYQHEIIGRNARMDEIQAAILRVKLRHLERWNDQRRDRALHLNAALASTSLELPAPCIPGVIEVFHLYVVRHSERHRLREHLAARGIATGIHYPIPIHLQPAYTWLGYAPESFPVTERWAVQCLSLPMYAELTEQQLDYIVAAVHEFEAAGA